MTEIIALQTDYGLDGQRPALLKEKLYELSPGCEVYDAVHTLTPGDIVAASVGIYSALQFYPKGSIYLSDVTDGKSARLCAAKTFDGHYIVTPDNGTLTAWYNFFGLEEVREVSDLAQAAATIALNTSDFEKVGPKYDLSEIVLIKAKAPTVSQGFVKCSLFSIVKGFGNLNLNVTYDEFDKSGIAFGDYVSVQMTENGKVVFSCPKVLFAKSFGFVEVGDPVLFNGSTGYMGFGLNLKNFCKEYIPAVYDKDCDISIYEMTFSKV